MSYRIEYARQFIRSDEGITPCWLSGDNNVYSIVGCGPRRYERRARDWSVFQNMVGTTEADLLQEVESWMGGYQEHWMRGGKWVDDKALRRWVISGCKDAATVEEILRTNPAVGTIRCYCSCWVGLDNSICDEKHIKTTAGFDQWVRQVKNHIAASKDTGESLYPIVDFGVEKVKNPHREEHIPSGDVIIKSRIGYLAEVKGDNCCWNKSIHKAMVLSPAQLDAFRKEHFSGGTPYGTRIISAKNRLTHPYDAVLVFRNGAYSGRYVVERRKNGLRLTDNREYAKRYASRKEAEKVASKLQPIFSSAGSLTVEIVEG